jgi:glutamyl-tRNA synthetase
MNTRTRFAPSPTGFLHVGGVRTALFAWLVARQTRGQFILRIEDTDRTRHVKESEQHIQNCLKWLGLDWNEGPFRQSERLGIYKEWANKLVAAGRAYADPYDPKQLEEFRQEAASQKKPFLFRNHRPENLPAWDGSQPLRFKSEPKEYRWHDEVMGELSTGPEVVDDFIILKSDGFPTYNFAHIVDDHLMQITHVIRSQEFLPSMPKFLNLYEALEIEPPKFATLPYVMSPDGNKKLSKRDGAKDIMDYKNDGYLPEAVINLLATLGWNDGTTQEIFSIDELTKKFSLERVQKGGAQFDGQRLNWLNGHYIRELSKDGLYQKISDFWPVEAKSADEKYKTEILSLVQERLKYFSELPGLTSFFFVEPLPDMIINLYKNPVDKQLKKLGLADIRPLLEAANEELGASNFGEEDLQNRLNILLEKLDTKPGILFAALRIAVTGAKASPELSKTLHVLGREKSLERLQKTIIGLAK